MKTRSKDELLVAPEGLPPGGEEDEDYGDMESGIDEDELNEDELDTAQVASVE